MARKPIDPARVRELFTYCPETGVLRWAKPISRATRVGDVAGFRKDGDYWQVKIDGRRYRRSRLIWAYVYGEDAPGEIDHRDRDKGNDRLGNLRLATRARNMVNAHYPKPVHPDLPRGVRPKRRSGFVIGYRGRISLGDRRLEFGPYPTPELARTAVERALAERHGAEWIPRRTEEDRSPPRRDPFWRPESHRVRGSPACR